MVPHYYLSIEVNVDKLLATRAKFNKKLEKQGVKLSVNDFIIKAVAMTNKKVRKQCLYFYYLLMFLCRRALTLIMGKSFLLTIPACANFLFCKIKVLDLLIFILLIGLNVLSQGLPKNIWEADCRRQ